MRSRKSSCLAGLSSLNSERRWPPSGCHTAGWAVRAIILQFVVLGTMQREGLAFGDEGSLKAICSNLCEAQERVPRNRQKSSAVICNSRIQDDSICELDISISGYLPGRYCLDRGRVFATRSEAQVLSTLGRLSDRLAKLLLRHDATASLVAVGVSDATEFVGVLRTNECSSIQLPLPNEQPDRNQHMELGRLRAKSLLVNLLRKVSGPPSQFVDKYQIKIRGNYDAAGRGGARRRASVAVSLRLTTGKRPPVTETAAAAKEPVASLLIASGSTSRGQRTLRQFAAYPGVSIQLPPAVASTIYGYAASLDLTFRFSPQRLKDLLRCDIELLLNGLLNRDLVLFNNISQPQIFGAVSVGPRLLWPLLSRRLQIAVGVELRGSISAREIQRVDLPIHVPERQLGLGGFAGGALLFALDLSRPNAVGGRLQAVGMARIGWMPLWVDQRLLSSAPLEMAIGLGYAWSRRVG